MADVMSILSANYKTVGLTVPSKTPVCRRRSDSLRGQLDRQIRRQQDVQGHVSNVTGFRAKVHYQCGGTNKFQEVLIKDNAFRIGDTKFTLTKRQGRSRTSSPIRRPARPFSTPPTRRGN